MKGAREVRDDFHGAIKAATGDETLVPPAKAVKKEGRSSLVLTYDGGKRFRATVEEVWATAKVRIPNRAPSTGVKYDPDRGDT